FGPLPPLPQPASSPADNNDDDNDDDDGAFCFAPQIAQCGSRIRDTLVDNALGVSLPTTNNSTTTSSPFLLPPLPPKQQQPLPKQQQQQQPRQQQPLPNLPQQQQPKQQQQQPDRSIIMTKPTQSPSPTTLLPHSDKRESSQSESETIVFSPRADQCDSSTDDAALEYPAPSSTRTATPELKTLPQVLLPTLPTIQSLDDMTKDLLSSSAVFDNLEFSSYWTNTGFC
ncbi:hypothetical protein GGI00_004134, partial [Coemansia sp. RSA 2681]